jgi:hypothetical protein
LKKALFAVAVAADAMSDWWEGEGVRTRGRGEGRTGSGFSFLLLGSFSRIHLESLFGIVIFFISEGIAMLNKEKEEDLAR